MKLRDREGSEALHTHVAQVLRSLRGNADAHLRALSNSAFGSSYLRGGETLEILMPLGAFRLCYAAGRVWWGEQYLFGLDTYYVALDETLHFSRDDKGYSRHRIQLQKQRNGNLRDLSVIPAEF